ncbi:MAG: hypothetical protein ACI8QS_000381 [Planctomycetota bacterium]|jgi:hypothetical protein
MQDRQRQGALRIYGGILPLRQGQSDEGNAASVGCDGLRLSQSGLKPPRARKATEPVEAQQGLQQGTLVLLDRLAGGSGLCPAGRS